MNKGTAVISDPVLVFDGNDGINHTIEGLKFISGMDFTICLHLRVESFRMATGDAFEKMCMDRMKPEL